MASDSMHSNAEADTTYSLSNGHQTVDSKYSCVCCDACVRKFLTESNHTGHCSLLRNDASILEDKTTSMTGYTRTVSIPIRNEEHHDYRKQSVSPVAHRPPSVPPMCADHKELIKHYCMTCNVSICATCVTTNHVIGDHNIKVVSFIHKQQREETKRVLKGMDLEILECEQNIQELTMLKRQIQLTLSLQEANIDRHIESAIAKIHKEAIILKFILREKEQLRIAEVNREISRLNKLIEEMTLATKVAQETVDNTSRHVYVVTHDKVIESLKCNFGKDTKGCMSRNPIIGMNKCPFDVPFTVQIHTHGLVKLQKCRLELIQEFGNHAGSCDIVLARCGLLVVCDRHAKQILMYNEQKNGLYKKQSVVSLSSKNSPKGSYGVTVTSEGKLLVTRSTHVEVYSLSGKYEGLVKVKHPDKMEDVHIGAYVIKVMSEDNILVADRERSIINQISSGGYIIKTIQTGIIPHRMAILPHGHIALSDWKNGKVGVINLKSAKTVRIFNIPNAKGLHYHKETDCILVGRYRQLTEDGTPMAGTGVIEQYCSTSGRLVGCIAEGLCCPQNLTVIQDNVLAVADYKTIKLYRIT